MPRKTEDTPETVEVAISTEDGFAYYELTAEQAGAYEDAGRDNMYVLLNGKKVRQTKVTPAATEEVDV